MSYAIVNCKLPFLHSVYYYYYSRQFVLMFVSEVFQHSFQVSTRRSLRNKCLNISGATACLMNRFHFVKTYDMTTILVSLTETTLFDENELSPVLLSSSDWHLRSCQEQENKKTFLFSMTEVSHPRPLLIIIKRGKKKFVCLFVVILKRFSIYSKPFVTWKKNCFSFEFLFRCEWKL